MNLNKKGYTAPAIEIFELRIQENLLQASQFGDGSTPGQTMIDDGEYTYEL
ncbi:MAG: hypothetical protein ACSW72_06280 [Bacteroidales bacterium]